MNKQQKKKQERHKAIIKFIKQNSPTQARDIAKQFRIDKSTVNVHVIKLAEDGLIERIRISNNVFISMKNKSSGKVKIEEMTPYLRSSISSIQAGIESAKKVFKHRHGEWVTGKLTGGELKIHRTTTSRIMLKLARAGLMERKMIKAEYHYRAIAPIDIEITLETFGVQQPVKNKESYEPSVVDLPDIMKNWLGYPDKNPIPEGVELRHIPEKHATYEIAKRKNYVNGGTLEML